MKTHPLRQITRLVNRLFPWAMDAIYEVQYFIQRGRRGFSDRDCWVLCYHFDEMIPEIMRWIKQHKRGVPIDFVEKAIKARGAEWKDQKEHDVDYGAEIYSAMLDEIIVGFNAHKELMEKPWDMFGDDEERKKAYIKERQDLFERSMRLLTEHYDTLGD